MDNQNSHTSYYPDIGTEGERFVAQWLQQQGWQVLAAQWHCRWGEVDLIAYHPGEDNVSDLDFSKCSAISRAAVTEPTLAFIEVKTRSRGNWDADGRLAVNSHKRTKIGRTAQAYLAAHPGWAEYPCRFDVAIVKSETLRHATGTVSVQLQVEDYLANAWDFF